MAKKNTYFQDEVIQKKVDVRLLGRVFRYMKPYIRWFVLVGALMLTGAGLAMLSPLLLRRIIDSTTVNKNYKELVIIIVSMSVVALLEIGINFAHQRIMGIVGHKIICDVRKEIFYKLQELPFDYFDSRPNGKIVVRVTDYVNDLANFFTNYVLNLLSYIVKLVMTTFFMLGLSPALTGVVFLIVIPMMTCVMILRYFIRKEFSVLRAKNSNRSAFLVETIMGEKIVKSYNRAESSEKTYDDIHDKCVKQWLRIVKRNELNTPIVETFWNLGTLSLYGASLYLILHGNVTLEAGLIVAFAQYMTQFSGPITMIAMMIQQLAQVTSNLEQVFDTIDYPVEIRNEKDCEVLEHVRGKVDFNDVTFAYDEGVNILEHFDLHVKPGETIALVGPTGAGKTTVINMLTRFYDVREGSVTVDDKDVRNVTLDSLRREVGVLMQEPFIFKGTILENIRYGRLDATDEECIAAAKFIYADDFINRFTDGYNHVLEERGNGLSAGEKQLLSFARIILKNPSIVILDEATSSIDTETEALIQKALSKVLKDKTAFMVAHRLSTIRSADRILYISNKGIAEQGSHEELMALKGLYYALN